MNTSSFHYSRSIPIRHTVDILVAGGGPAGVAAALAARRQGARVHLIEEQGCLGGMGTAGMVPAFMPFGDGVHFLAEGVGRQVYTALKKMNAPMPLNNPLGCVSIHVESLKRVYDEMLLKSGCSFTFHTQLIDVRKKGNRLTHAICAAKSGVFAIEAKVFVDGTGDGDLAAWGGAPFEKGDKNGRMMPGTLCSIWSDLDWKAIAKNKVPQSSQLKKAFADGVFTVKDDHLPGIFHIGETTGGGNIGHTFGVDNTDEVSITKALLWGRKSLSEYQRYYQHYLKGYEKMNLVTTGALLGIRETRRIMGDYVLGLEDFKKRAVFEDEIGRFAYPIDIHPTRPGKKTYARFLQEYIDWRYKPGESYGIPYRILTPRRLDNVLVAGRCVSSDRYIQGSIRVMPGCYITGQAAGIAAAMAAQSGASTHDIPVKELQKRLKKFGAYLPNDH
ncbi:MAG: FAD-dependent oxidoreductase [Verrucomicrobiae bacterium]|nr:FAD-dependent oxidoreductase [Verrucomicrobiae bacterium]